MSNPESTHAISPLDGAATQRALTEHAVTVWWQTTGFLAVHGADATRLLDSICTQAVDRIEAGTSAYALFLTAKAKILAPTVLHHRTTDETGDSHWIIETLPECCAPLETHLRRYRLRAKAEIEHADLATIAVVGAAAETLAPPDADGLWVRPASRAFPTLQFIGRDDECARLVSSNLPALGFEHAAAEALEAARIDAGFPGLHDFALDRMPAEVGAMDAAVSLDKGCYIGQEPVARLHYRGHANRTLQRVEAPGSIQPAPPSAQDHAAAPLELRMPDTAPDSRALGFLTTWATRPDGSTTGFAVLRRELDAGTHLELPNHGGVLTVTGE